MVASTICGAGSLRRQRRSALLDRDGPPGPGVPSFEATVGGALAHGAPAADVLPRLPQIISPAPLPGTRTTHEYHQAAAMSPNYDIEVGKGAELSHLRSPDLHGPHRTSPACFVRLLRKFDPCLVKDMRR